MGKNVQALGVGMLGGGGVEGVASCRIEWRGGPFALGFEE